MRSRYFSPNVDELGPQDELHLVLEFAALLQGSDVAAAIDPNKGLDAIEERLNDVATIPRTAGYLYYARARVLADLGRKVDAVNSYKSALDQPLPKLVDINCRYELASLWMEMGEIGEAQAEYARCIELGTSARIFSTAARSLERLSMIAGDGEDYVEALALSQQADELWLSSGDNLERARSLRRTGEILNLRMRKYEEAEKYFRSALEIYEEHSATALISEAQTYIADSLESQGIIAEATELAGSAVAISRDANPEHLPRALYVQGRALARSDNEQEAAINAFKESALVAEDAGNKLIWAQATGDLAVLLSRMQRFDEAIEWNSKSMSLYVDEGNVLGQITCLRNESHLKGLVGNTEAAVEAIQRARSLAIEMGDRAMAAELSMINTMDDVTQGSLATLILDTIDMNLSAAMAASQSMEEFEREAQKIFFEFIGKMTADMDAEAALSFVFDIAHEAGLDDRVRIAAGLAYAGLQKWNTHRGVGLPKLRVKFASMLLRIGDRALALDELRRSMIECREFGDEQTYLVCASELARTEQLVGNIAASRQILQEALDKATSDEDIEPLKMNLAVCYMREWNFGAAEPLLNEVLDSSTARGDLRIRGHALGNLAMVQVDTNRIDEALRTIGLIGQGERAAQRANELVFLLQEEARVFGEGGMRDDALLAYHAAVELIDRNRSALISTGLQSSYASTHYPLYSDAISLASVVDPAQAIYFAEHSRARGLAAEIGRPSPLNRNIVPRDVVARAQARLGANELVLTFYITESTLYSWAIANNSIVQHRLDITREDVFALAGRYWESWRDGHEDAELGRQITDLLVAPHIASMDGISTLFIAPHGPLHLIPFAALGSDRRLVEQVDLAIIPALHLLDRSGPWQDSWREHGFIIANPDGTLPAADAEATQVSAAFSHVTVQSGADATRDALLAAWSKCTTIHIASHAAFDSANPLMSGILLAPRDVFTISDIIQLPPIKAKLVVLSACETRLSASGPSDDAIGLAPAFLVAGSEIVLSSLWKVDDAGTSHLMQQFYSHLSAGRAPIAALSEAQRDMIAEDCWRASDWAAFECYTLVSSRRFRSSPVPA